MNNILKSRIFALAAFIVVVILVIVSLVTDRIWKVKYWTLADELFLFLAVFCQLVSTLVKDMSPVVARRLTYSAFVCLALSVVAFFVEYFVLS